MTTHSHGRPIHWGNSVTAHKVHPEQSNLKPKKPHTPIPQNLERNREAYTPPEHTVTGSLESEGTHKDQSPTPWSFQDYLKLNHMALDGFCKISAAENLCIMGSNYSSFSFFPFAPMLSTLDSPLQDHTSIYPWKILLFPNRADTSKGLKQVK